MLDEYISRFNYVTGIPNDDLVEFFYANENNSADTFRILLDKYEKEIPSYNVKIQDHNGSPRIIIENFAGVIPPSFNIRIKAHNWFYSKSLSSIINSLYVRDSRGIATLNKDYILTLSDDLKYAYLKGAYQRFGRGNELSIANGIKKLKTIALVMESLGIKNIILYSSGPDTLPTDFILTFDTSDNLKDKIGFKDSDSRLKYYPQKHIVNYK